MNVTVVVATFGTSDWQRWGDEAASEVTDAPVLRVHQPKGTLAQARNAGLSQVESDYVCFLDADDALEPGYLERDLVGDIVVTPLDGAIPTANNHQHLCGPHCLSEGNYIHVGAIVRTSLLRGVGGFREHAVYEDWELWLRCAHAGATFQRSVGPSYVTRVRGAGGRNTALPRSLRLRARANILDTYKKERS